MNYSQDAFLKLMEAVEDQGGEHLDETCEDRLFQIPMRRGGEPQPFPSERCGEPSLFEVPYKPRYPEKADEAGEVRLVKVCAVDDSMGAWPRFQDIVGWEGVTT